MQILWLADFYPPHIGGLERHVQMVCRKLATLGHSIAVATIRGEDTPVFELDGDVRVYRLTGLAQKFKRFYADERRRFHPTAPDPSIVNHLLKIVEVEKPQIVIASGWILYSFLPIKARSNAKLLVRHHDYAFICPKRSLLFKDHVCSGPELIKCYRCAAENYGWIKGSVINTSFKIFSCLHDKIDYHIPVSQSVSKSIDLVSHSSASNKRVVPAPVPDEIIRGQPGKLHPPGIPDIDFILYVGALTKHKGLNILLEAYKGLESRAGLLLIGTEWPDSPTNFPDSVTVIKNAPHSFTMEAFHRCLFSVVPSLWAEPFGQVAVEAMTAGKPVIASNHGGLKDIVIDQVTGILVEPGDPVILRSAMETLIDNIDLRSRLGKAGQARAEKYYTCSEVTGQIEAICEAVLNNNFDGV